MQNQKTERKVISVDSLPELSAEEMALVEAIGAGDTNTDAYAKAYGRGNYSRAALHVQACRKVAEPKIQAHLSALRAVGFARAAAKHVLSREGRVEAELALAERQEQAENWGAVGATNDRINKLLGHYSETVKLEVADPLETLRQIAQVSPDLAQQLAASQGIPWQPKPATQADKPASMH